MDEVGMMADLQRDMTRWIAEGQVAWTATAVDGLENVRLAES